MPDYKLSDKASVEITLRFDGVVKALHYAQDDIAIVGLPLLDLDIKDDVAGEELTIDRPSKSEGIFEGQLEQPPSSHVLTAPDAAQAPTMSKNQAEVSSRRTKSAMLTPAVRHILKEAKINPTDVEGTGKDGRITKEDVQRHLSINSNPYTSKPKTPSTPAAPASELPTTSATEDKVLSLTAVESKMFQVMTQSINIPHFLYTQNVDVTSLNKLRQSFNEEVAASTNAIKLSPLPFIMKALSQAFLRHPKLNSHLDTTTIPAKPQLILKASHNFGLAVDTPQGLLVPVIRNVQSHSIISLAQEINRLSNLAKVGRLASEDFKGASFTISNIGSIGGGVVSPIIVSPMVGILAAGRALQVPVYTKDKHGVETVTKQEQVVLSWSADHRVLDGATVAKAAEYVKELLANVHKWALHLR